jgi:hypothetical protein
LFVCKTEFRNECKGRKEQLDCNAWGFQESLGLGTTSMPLCTTPKSRQWKNASQNFTDAEALPIFVLIRPFATTTNIFASQHSPRCKPATLDGVSTMYLCHVRRRLLTDRFILHMHAPAEQVLLTIPKNQSINQSIDLMLQSRSHNAMMRCGLKIYSSSKIPKATNIFVVKIIILIIKAIEAATE